MRADRAERRARAEPVAVDDAARADACQDPTDRPATAGRRPTPARAAHDAGLRYAIGREPGPEPPSRRPGLHVSRARRPSRSPIAEALAPDQGPRHPAGLDRRLDLPAGRTATCRPPAATRAAASSTATTRAGATRRETDKFDRMLAFAAALPRDPGALRRGPRQARAAAREGARGRRPAARADADPRRQRRVRAPQPLVRADDPARPARDRSRGTAIRFRFRGKSGLTHEVGLRDRRLAARRPALPGAARARSSSSTSTRTARSRDVASEDVNDYLREASGGDFTAKDFRTWAGTVLAYRALRALQPGDDERDARRNVVEAIRQTAGAPRQHARGRPPELRPPRRPRGVPGRRHRRARSSRPPRSRSRHRPRRRPKRRPRSWPSCASASMPTPPASRLAERARHGAKRTG